MIRLITKVLSFLRDAFYILGRLAFSFVKLFGVAAAVVIVAGATFAFALYEAGYFHRLVRLAIEKYLARYTQTECRVGRVEGNLLTGMDIYDFVVGNGPSLRRDGAALIIDEIHVSYDPIRFIRRDVTIDRVHVVRPRLVLNKDADGIVNLSRIFGAKGPPRGKGVYFVVAQVIIDDAHFKMFLDSPLTEFTQAHIECTFTKARGAVFIDLRHCSAYLPEFGQRVPHFGSGSLAINARRMHFRGVDVTSATTSITTDGTIKFEPEPFLDLRFAADRFDVGEVGQGVFGTPPEFFGYGRYAGTLVGPDKALEQEGQLFLERGYLYGNRLEDVFVYYDFDIAGRQIRMKGFDGRVNDTPTFVKMTVDFQGPRPVYWGEARLLGVNLADYVDNPFLTTDVDCAVRFSGVGLAADDYAVTASAHFGAGQLGPIIIDRGTADFRYARGRADITGLALRAGGGELSLSGWGDQRRSALKLTARRLPLERLKLGKRLSRARGLVSFEGTVAGPHQRPTFEGALVLNDFSYDSLKLGAARVEGRWDDYGGANRAQAHAILWDVAWGPLRLSRAYGDVAAADNSWQVSRGYLETPRGAGAFFDLSYDRRREVFELSRLEMKLAGGNARLSAPLTFARAGSRFELRGGVIAYAGGEISASGSYAPATAALNLTAEARRVPLAGLVPEDVGVAVGGTLNRLRLDVTGTKDAPVLYANLAASNLKINGQPIDYVHGEASYDEGRVIVPGLVAGLAGGTMRVTAFVPLARAGGEGPLDATLWFSKFKLNALSAFFKPGLFDAGFMEGVVTATGTTTSPVIHGNLLLSEVKRGALSFAKGRANFTYRDGALELRELSLAEKTLPNLIVRGRLPFKRGAESDELALGVDLIDLDLRVVNLFTDEVFITGGKVRGRVDFGGTYERPNINGRVTFADGEGVSRTLRSSFTHLYGPVEMRGDEVAVGAAAPLTFGLDEGEGRAWGRLELEGFSVAGMDISVEVSHYVVQALSGVRVRGDIAANIKGAPGALRATADMDVESGLITIAFGEAGEESAPSPSAFDYEVRVRCPGKLWLRNDVADIEFEADVTFRRTGGVPVYTGELRARRGYYYFLSRDFEIERAVITFTGTEELDPVLDIRANRVLRARRAGAADAVVSINVSGTLREPEVELSYESLAGPPAALSQDDILKVLALDVTWEDYEAMSTSELASAESGDYVRRYAEAEVARVVRRKAGVDVFQFESNVFAGAEEDPYAEFTVGQHLTKDIFVSYTGEYREYQVTGGTALTHAAEVDYELDRNLYLVGSTFEDEGMQRYGLGVRFIHKY